MSQIARPPDEKNNFFAIFKRAENVGALTASGAIAIIVTVGVAFAAIANESGGPPAAGLWQSAGIVLAVGTVLLSYVPVVRAGNSDNFG